MNFPKSICIITSNFLDGTRYSADSPKVGLQLVAWWFPFQCSYIHVNILLGCILELSGDTFTDGSVRYSMTSMNVPEPVMSLAVSPVSKDSGGQVSCKCMETISLLSELFCQSHFDGAPIVYIVLESFKSISKRRSHFPCGLGSWKWSGNVAIYCSWLFSFFCLQNFDYLIWT